jgi:hypothetical protein
MTLARRFGPVVQLPPPADTGLGDRPALPALLPLGDVPAADGARTPAGRFRRCTFRRIDRLVPLELPARGRRSRRRAVPARGYVVMCLLEGRESMEALGDLASAQAACAACQAAGIFRPDEA